MYAGTPFYRRRVVAGSTFRTAMWRRMTRRVLPSLHDECRQNDSTFRGGIRLIYEFGNFPRFVPVQVRQVCDNFVDDAESPEQKIAEQRSRSVRKFVTARITSSIA